MGKVYIVTDSTADIPADIREALGIEMVPLKVHFEQETYLDAVTIQSRQFYEKLKASAVLPTTSQPSPVEFLSIYKRLAAADPGASIISIHLSAALSGTYQSAVLAKNLLQDSGIETDITIIDSKLASYGIGLLAVKAAEAAQAGQTKEECLAIIERISGSMALYFLVDTLEFLQKGGRIGKAAAFVGSLLNIKPILMLDEGGEVTSIDKVRGQKKAMARLIDIIKENHQFTGDVEVIIAHSEAPELAETMSELVKQQFSVRSQIYTSIGSVIGTHVGPGTVAVIMYPV